ncbi:MAG: iron-containing alcohol dehydrogenase [Pseudomonadales bacterium]|jgi:alcohol dehydrogenase|nr:iron-containing alcohol dehydrogenase [Pseudomonadales bacterium]
MAYYYFMPVVNIMGAGGLADAGKEIEALGFRKALIVTDEALHRELRATRVLTELLERIGVDYAVYDGVEPNPTTAQVDAGVALLREQGCDFIISFGGGSPHDAAKAIGILATHGGDIRDFEGINRMTRPMLPLVAINTTSGTASEMTRFAIITDEQRHVKMAIVDWRTTPTLSVDDPDLMEAMPPDLTAATGMDALTHAIEAYVSTAATPVTDSAALHAMRLVAGFLPRAVADGHDKEAREMMTYAEFLAGMAFNSASLGYVHAMAHQLGGFYDLPHGVCNAILLPHVQAWNARAVPERFVEIAAALGVDTRDLTPAAAAEAALDAIRSLAATVGIPPNLAAFDVVKPEDFPTLADNAMKDACGVTNPKQPTHAEVVALYEAAYGR